MIRIMRSGQGRLDDILIPANRAARHEAYPILQSTLAVRSLFATIVQNPRDDTYLADRPTLGYR